MAAKFEAKLSLNTIVLVVGLVGASLILRNSAFIRPPAPTVPADLSSNEGGLKLGTRILPLTVSYVGQTERAVVAPGKPVLLYFTSPSCPPCKELNPKLSKVTNAGTGLFKTVLIVENATSDREIADSYGSFTAAKVNDDARSLFTKLNSHGTPRLYLLDAQGKLVWSVLGASEDMTEQFLTSTIRNKLRKGGRK